MTRARSWMGLGLAILMAVAAACSGHEALSEADAGDDAGMDGGLDAPPDGSDGGDGSGGDDGGPPPPPPPAPGELAELCGGVAPVSVAEWERCRQKRYCQSHVHCSEQNLYASVEECELLLDDVSGGQLGFDTGESARSVAAGRAQLDEREFTQCLRDLSPKLCATAGTAASCGRRYRGVINDQADCFSDAECRSPGATCAPRDCGAACCAGKCTAQKRLGEPCRDFRACEPGLVCSLTSATCVLGDLGSACGHYDCDAGGWCDGGTCKADRAEGAACDSLLQCGGETSCVGLRRTAQPARCRRVTEEGDACDWYCLGNLVCDLSGSTTGLGVCRRLPKQAGESCSALLPCASRELRCDERGACVPRARAGEPCSGGVCAPGLFCTDQLGEPSPVCRAPMADGATGCVLDAQCRSHLCSGDQSSPGQCLAPRLTCP